MNCINPELLSAYADRQADAAEIKEVDRHVSACKSCRAKLDGFLAMKAQLKALPIPLMPQELKKSLKALGTEDSGRLSVGFWQPAFGLAALSMTAFIVRLDRVPSPPSRVIAAERIAEAHMSMASFPLSFEPGGLETDSAAAAEDAGDE